MSIFLTFELAPAERAALLSIAKSLTHLETLVMTLNAQGQAIVDAINAATTKIGGSVGEAAHAMQDATTAITDLVGQLTNGTISATEFQTAIQPSLDTLNTTADQLHTTAAALEQTATAADPALQTPPAGGETPVTPTP